MRGTCSQTPAVLTSARLRFRRGPSPGGARRSRRTLRPGPPLPAGRPRPGSGAYDRGASGIRHGAHPCRSWADRVKAGKNCAVQKTRTSQGEVEK
ncbi:hypothetical protein SLNWT_0881 [Streptomyces albus]|uniref:Uncharacterized protein n=1 Tax=Streptomyces albus (strain ATCC 21838 / DSM 41398 / FERM P-419 / JCM 4703 / NBRC 107858) TaxID=1081613 RepID=A0A0B5ESZ2_STRA4|nr:hypothetical protein SLNWT_0881 [Streptomyces albus]AOU75572.1 hypothetical protein SLNHY_0881 [Streptomyces albus]